MPKIEYVNFVPRSEFAKEARRLLESLIAESPSDSSTSVRASIQGTSFRFEVDMRSAQGRFRGEAVLALPEKGAGDRLWQREAIVEVVDQISRQIFVWRRRRFSERPSSKTH